ncbi:MAG: hypothetical protein IJK63_01250 [Oscillospiraceae bacterium]|nr:hypothetical protein [Oscillospiraceae bacterium]
MKNWKDELYVRGYLLTDDAEIFSRNIGLDRDKWAVSRLGSYYLYVSRKETFYVHESEGGLFVLVGHAYNPFSMEHDESAILRSLVLTYGNTPAYRDTFDQLTGIFAYFIIEGNRITAICDCAGMMGAYYGVIHDKTYFSSHAQMIADLTRLAEDPYITALKKSRTFKLYGLYLPYNLSPYSEVKRILPNTEVRIENKTVTLERFYPRMQYCVDPDYASVVSRAAQLLHNNMVLIARKWTHPAISLTGGTDSKTTLACASDVQDRFLYYSYISLPREATDSYAAQKICQTLGLQHEIYEIDTDVSHHDDFYEVDRLIERHYGYLGKGNQNDVCKRICLSEQFHSDIEVKSWVSEVARASRYTKYNKDKLPATMTARMLTSMYKIFIFDRWNALRTDKIFKQYLEETGLLRIIQDTHYPWSEFFVWEIVFGGWGGLALSGEHKLSNNITVPFNNRAILDLMLRTPLEKRKTDQLHRDIMDCMDPRINKLGIHVVNGNETKKREILEGLYFDIHSHLPL